MPALPPRLSLEQVRRLAKDLLRDRSRTPLNLCRKSLAEHEGVDGYREVEAILVPITDPIFGGWPPTAQRAVE